MFSAAFSRIVQRRRPRHAGKLSLQPLLCCLFLGVAATIAAPAAIAQSAGTAAAQPPGLVEKVSRGEDRKAVAVTIYNESLALIREEREVTLTSGRNLLALREVSAMIRPETATMRSLSGARFNLFEQNFDFDLLTPQKLLDKYVGKKVTVIRDVEKNGDKNGREIREEARVLANNQGVVLQYTDRIETGVPDKARIVYSEVPANLRDRPTLVVDFNSDKGGVQRTELSYLSGGLSWKADYVVSLADDEKTLDLAGWVTLTNMSGAAYENAKLQLVAGDVNRVREALQKSNILREAPMVASAAPQMVREELFEYHLYTLGRTTTLRDQQTKQVALLSAAKVPVKKEYRMEGATHWYYDDNRIPELGDKRNVEVFIEFDNKGGDLGEPLPKGIVRVYKKDKEGRPLFVGEDGIEHTPKNETVRLKLGKAFDVTGNWKRTDFSSVSKKISESAVTVKLSNAKNVPVTVKVVEPIPGDWKMLKENFPHTKTTANTATWNVEVPANGSRELTYRVQMKW